MGERAILFQQFKEINKINLFEQLKEGMSAVRPPSAIDECWFWFVFDWWVMGAAAPMAPPREENQTKNQQWNQWRKKAKASSAVAFGGSQLIHQWNWCVSWWSEEKSNKRNAKQPRCAVSSLQLNLPFIQWSKAWLKGRKELMGLLLHSLYSHNSGRAAGLAPPFNHSSNQKKFDWWLMNGLSLLFSLWLHCLLHKRLKIF